MKCSRRVKGWTLSSRRRRIWDRARNTQPWVCESGVRQSKTILITRCDISLKSMVCQYLFSLGMMLLSYSIKVAIVDEKPFSVRNLHSSKRNLCVDLSGIIVDALSDSVRKSTADLFYYFLLGGSGERNNKQTLGYIRRRERRQVRYQLLGQANHSIPAQSHWITIIDNKNKQSYQSSY